MIEIPASLRHAHEDGNVVFFCGAGVSAAAGLPTFKQLVATLRDQHLQIPEQAGESQAYNRDLFDRYLHLLELRIGTTTLRRAVLNIVDSQVTPPSPTPTHRLLLELSRTHHSELHLVTTNFDTLFERASAGVLPPINIDSAPRLHLSPDGPWDSLVYLHGRVDRTRDPGGRDLVLSSGDFGNAYLTEGYASRFLSVLLRRFHIVFVGYSASDPVVAYILDSLASNTLRNTGNHTAHSESRLFAFAPHDHGTASTSARDTWIARGVKPLTYELTSLAGHDELVACLTRWVRDWRDGLASKSRAAQEVLQRRPDALTADETSRLRWALSDPSGRPARALFGQAPNGIPATADWCEWLSQHGFLENVAPSLPVEHSSEVPRLHPLVSTQHASVPQLRNERAATIVRWLGALAIPATGIDGVTNSESLLAWMLSRGGALHPMLRQMIFTRIADGTSLPPSLKHAWRLLCDPAVNVSIAPSPLHDITARIVRAIGAFDWSALNVLELVSLLDPLARFSAPALGVARLRQLGIPEVQIPVSAFLDTELLLRCDEDLPDIEQALGSSRTNLPWQVLALPVTERLMRVLEIGHLIHTDFGLFESQEYPNVRGLATAPRSHSWTFLADLSWECARALDSAGNPLALSVYNHWIAARFPTTSRLALKAALEWQSLSLPDIARSITNA